MVATSAAKRVIWLEIAHLSHLELVEVDLLEDVSSAVKMVIWQEIVQTLVKTMTMEEEAASELVEEEMVL